MMIFIDDTMVLNEWMNWKKNKIDSKMNEKIWNEPVKNHYRTKKIQNFYA